MKKLTLCFLTACAALMFSLNAFAYIDVTTVSLLATSIAGVAVACGAAFFVIWRRIRSKVSKTFGLDENAGKEVEEDLSVNEEAAAELEKNEKN